MSGVSPVPTCGGDCSPRAVLTVTDGVLVGVVGAYAATQSMALTVVAALTALSVVFLMVRQQQAWHAAR